MARYNGERATFEGPFIRTLRLRNILSYGTNSPDLELRSLNVLIGPNGSGKSNLIQAIDLIRSLPTDAREPFRAGGGVDEWLWKGANGSSAEVTATLANPDGRQPLRYKLTFASQNHVVQFLDELIENEQPYGHHDIPYRHYWYCNGRPVIYPRPIPRNDVSSEDSPKDLPIEEIDPNQSILSQRTDPDLYPALAYLASGFRRMKLYRNWNIGRLSPVRDAQLADLDSTFLAEDFRNLAHVLNDIKLYHPRQSSDILKHLEKLNSVIRGIEFGVPGGRLQLFLRERDRESWIIPATRLSDGTLRFLCLLAILCHPNPPPLICIEEPELGLHPDVITYLGKLLIDASQRMQIVVTTHSDVLVSALSEVPEAIVVCEHDGESTQLRRLDAGQLDQWLEKYALGELWSMGELGGNP